METTPPQQNDSSLEQKLDEVLEVLKKIERQGHKNFWAGGAKFVILNATKIIASVLLLIFVWKIWSLVSSISGGFDVLLEKISSLKFW